MSAQGDDLDHVGRIMAQWRRERPDIDVTPQGVIGRLHRLADALHEEIRPVFAECGLSDGEFDVLAALRRAGKPYELTPSEIAASTLVTSGAVTKRVQRLLEAGLVTSVTSETDARSRRVALTARGLRTVNRAFDAHMTNEHRLVDGLTARERADLARLLEKWGRQLGV